MTGEVIVALLLLGVMLFCFWALAWTGSMILGVIGLLIVDARERKACPYPWGCLWMLGHMHMDLVFGEINMPFPLEILVMFKVHEQMALGFVIDVVSMPAQFYLRARWMREAKRQDVKKRMLAAVRRSNRQHLSDPDPEAMHNIRMFLDGIRRRPVH